MAQSATPYTEGDVHNAEILLQNTSTQARDPEVRARAKLVLALIALMDANSVSWRAELAVEINAAINSGALLQFDPLHPFNLGGHTDSILAELKVGHLNGSSLLKDFALHYGDTPPSKPSSRKH